MTIDSLDVLLFLFGTSLLFHVHTQSGKLVHKNLYAEYIIRNAGLDEAQAGIKLSRRNINKLRYTDDTTLMTESRGTKELLDEG